MECAFSDITCWVATFGAVLSDIDFLATVHDVSNWMAFAYAATLQFIKKNLELLIGVLGALVGIYRWWRHRERVLHVRLMEYLADQDHRLNDARSDVLEILNRPGPGRQRTVPLFAVPDLRRVLKRRRWTNVLTNAQIETRVDWQLANALRKIESRLETAERMLLSYRRQKAAAHLLRGALASARAENGAPHAMASELSGRALTDFRASQHVAGLKPDPVAKEFEAHQLRKLIKRPEDIAAVRQAYKELDDLSGTIDDRRCRELTLARAERYQAEMEQADALVAANINQQGRGGRVVAKELIESALARRASLAVAFFGWDLIEEGQMQYTAALIYNRLGYGQLENSALNSAESAFESVLTNTPRSRFYTGHSTRPLVAKAEDGRILVAEARENQYKTDWLVII